MFNPFGVGGYVSVLLSSQPPDCIRGYSGSTPSGLEGMWVCCCPPNHRIASGVIQVQPLRGWRVYVGMLLSASPPDYIRGYSGSTPSGLEGIL
ncbi:MAG: hypothetical protein KG029_09320 [Bacteroidetes bacterium]|nr:hypothetical protein [Bacteroidota bacterium]MBS4060587.1 hypothetical protein [Bacteroidota bacterium]